MILNQATERSLVILDEIGRGTATFDGLSIAWACVEYLHDKSTCRALFATHYHELTQLENELKKLKCYRTEIKEWNGKIIFMHRISPGKIENSYGIHVAELAGFPKNTVKRAEDILKLLVDLNKGNSTEISAGSLPLFSESNNTKKQHNQNNDERKDRIEEILAEIDINNSTPLEALNTLNKIKSYLKTEKSN